MPIISNYTNHSDVIFEQHIGLYMGNPTIQGNHIFAGGGNDIIYAGSGEHWTGDWVYSDIFNGGSGIDTVSYISAHTWVDIDLSENTAKIGNLVGSDAKGDGLISIENATGSQFNDLITGNNFANLLKGLNGNDRVWAGGGNDSLFGGNGNDTLKGEGRPRLHGWRR